MTLRWVSLVALAVTISACGGNPEPAGPTGPEGTMATTPSSCVESDELSRSALYQSAQAGEISTDVPPQLGVAVDAVPADLLTAVFYAGCSVELVDDLGFERMLWTNGIGLLVVGWQEWPGDGALVALPFGGSSQQAGVVQVSTADEMFGERTRVVHLFDGGKVVTVATFSLTTLSIEQVAEIAWAVYDAMPLDSSSRAGVGSSRSLGEFLAALPTDQIPVGDPEGLTELSPFTTALGIAHATYQFTVAGSLVTAYDFGALGAADRAAAALSSDGYTIAHTPYDVVAAPHYWRWDRLIIQYMGSDSVLIERLDEVAGGQFAGGTADS